MHRVRALTPAGVLIILLGVRSVGFATSLLDRFPPVGASSAGVGFAGVAMPEDPATTYWNPAGLAVSDQMAVDFTVAAPQLESPGSWSFLVANSSSGQGSRFGLALIRHATVRDTLDYRSFQAVVPLTYGFKSGKVPFGVSLKFISERFEDGNWHNGMSFDAGLLYLTPGGITVGAATRNITGSNLEGFRSESWLGGSWRGSGMPVIFSGQVRADRPFNAGWISRHFNVGAKLSPLRSVILLSGGYSRSGDDSWLTAGFGYWNRNNNTTIEYTFSVDVAEGNAPAHFLTYGYSMQHMAPPGVKGWR